MPTGQKTNLKMKYLNFKIRPKKPFQLIIIGLIFILLSPCLAIWLKHQQARTVKPTAFLSPLSENLNQVPVKNQPQSLNYYLSLARSLLEKATRLANDNPHQTEVDRLKIINLLNRSLKAANQAIETYPNQPEAYLIRAQIYQRTRRIWPQTADLAEKDLAVAKKLLRSPEASAQELFADYLPDKDTSPIQFIPAQQAQLAENLIIAGPDSDLKTTSSQTDQQTNALSGQALIPAGQAETIINLPALAANDFVYLLPQANPDNHTLYVKSRKQGAWFKAALIKPTKEDFKFDWWVIKDE